MVQFCRETFKVNFILAFLGRNHNVLFLSGSLKTLQQLLVRNLNSLWIVTEINENEHT